MGLDEKTPIRGTVKQTVHDAHLSTRQNGHGLSLPLVQRRGLSGKLLVLTIAFVMIFEVLIYVPSVANHRKVQLEEALAKARVAAAIMQQENMSVPETLKASLARETGALAIIVSGEGRKLFWELVQMPATVDKVVEPANRSGLGLVHDAFDTLFFGGNRVVRIVGDQDPEFGQVQLVIHESGVRQAMLEYSINVLILSLIISFATATAVFFSLRWIIVRPLSRILSCMESFAEDPENGDTVLRPSKRSDEIGTVEDGLAAMQMQVSQTIQQKRRLADLGLAVSKINHDLRNILASAQLFTDRLSGLDDPTAQRLAPKLVSTLDRAVTYTQAVMAYGKAGEAHPDRRLHCLRAVVDEVGSMLGLDDETDIAFINQVDDSLEIDADAGQLFRVVMNLCRNALQVMQAPGPASQIKRLTVSANRKGKMVCIRVQDTGPGVPERARKKLFKAFEGNVRPGGTGLGLAIASEIVRAHGGFICLVENGPGAIFEFTIPDRDHKVQGKPVVIGDNDDLLEAAQ